MIKDAVLHLNGKLPLLADLHTLPGPRDLNLLATNVRTRDGKRPSFAEETEAWFVIPLREVNAIELPAASFDVEQVGDQYSGEAENGHRGMGQAEPDAALLERIRQL